MEYKRELTKDEMHEAVAQSDLFQYNDSSTQFDERKAFYHGWMARAKTLPSATEIAQLKADNEKLRQALEEAGKELYTSKVFHMVATGVPLAYAERSVKKSKPVIAINTILSETKTINP